MSNDLKQRDGFDERLAALDLTLFETIGRPGWRGDARSLLAVHDATRRVHGSFSYLEIGSYLGASLQVHLADPSCTAIMSIDPRPEAVPDDRWEAAFFP
jgi:hypothetical protein